MRNTLKYIGPVLGGAAFITAALFMPTWDELHPEPETTLFSDEYIAEINCMEDMVVIIEDETTAAIKGVNYGMPCETYQCTQHVESVESVERSEDEQETSEESTEDRVLEETAEPDGYRVAGEGSMEAAPDDVPEPVAEPTTVETVPESAAPVQDEPVHEVHEMGLEDTLRAELDAAGIDWWYPYAYAQIQQESRWNPGAVSADGKDYGLLQYRAQFWTGPGDVMDPYAQIRKYVGQVAVRLNAGLSIEETISRHMTSDYVTEINWDYVNLVLSHLNQ